MRGVPRELRGPPRFDRCTEDACRTHDDTDEVRLRVEVEVVKDAETLAERCGEHARSRGGAHESEAIQAVLDAARVDALVHDEVDDEVLHGRVEQLLHDTRQAMDLVDEQDVAIVEVREDPHEVSAALDRGPRGGDQVRRHLVREDAGERRLAETWRTVEQHVVDALSALACGLDRDAKARDGLVLADVFLERARTELALELRLFRRCHRAQWRSAIAGHERLLAAAAR